VGCRKHPTNHEPSRVRRWRHETLLLAAATMVDEGRGSGVGGGRLRRRRRHSEWIGGVFMTVLRLPAVGLTALLSLVVFDALVAEQRCYGAALRCWKTHRGVCWCVGGAREAFMVVVSLVALLAVVASVMESWLGGSRGVLMVVLRLR